MKHYLIKTEQEFFVFGSFKTQNIVDMVEIFKTKVLGNDAEGNPVLLVRPFPKLYYKMLENE